MIRPNTFIYNPACLFAITFIFAIAACALFARAHNKLNKIDKQKSYVFKNSNRFTEIG